MPPNIALSGKSGVGKSTASARIVEKFGYQLCCTGSICRQITQALFGHERRDALNSISVAIRTIDPHIWIRAALRSAAPSVPIVLDSIRYNDDYSYVRGLDWKVVRIIAPSDKTVSRLLARRQEFNRDMDALHSSETALENVEYDATIRNDADKQAFLVDIDKVITRLMVV